jgi:hypothetical protein
LGVRFGSRVGMLPLLVYAMAQAVQTPMARGRGRGRVTVS